MAKKKIIFQGEPGANSHLACREAYPDHEPVPCPTFEDCFSALTGGDVDLGMIPIENSVAGRVADIHHLMPTSDLHIIAEWFLPIRNQLMAPKGASLKTIKSVESHVMALGQCRNIIRELKLKPIVAMNSEICGWLTSGRRTNFSIKSPSRIITSKVTSSATANDNPCSISPTKVSAAKKTSDPCAKLKTPDAL